MKNKEKIIKLSVSEFIDTKYRDYALYVLLHRGIPSFFDSLTPVQRYILKNTKNSLGSTLGVIGECIKDKYHHGDCFGFSTNINLAGGGQITIGEWAENFPDAELLVKSLDTETGKEIVDIGHSPRIGQITDDYIEIEMENGEIFKCTEDHLFLCNGVWVKAKNLKSGDDI